MSVNDDEPLWFLADRPPTKEEIEIAKEEARKRGWLTDTGWVWDEPEDSRKRPRDERGC
jgi:hypothetical protein